MERYINQDSKNFEDFIKDNDDELEGIIQNEPQKNKYETVGYHKMNQFPYYLIGKVVSKFEIDGINKFLNGVGILIGPNIVLTVAHNLCHLNQNKKILYTKKAIFFSCANGDFCLFEPVKSLKIFVPESYIEALKKEDKDEELLNDWGLIYLNASIGNSIINLLDIENKNELKINQGHLYNFFTYNEGLKLDKIVEMVNSEKISIIGYTEYKDKYKNNSAYKFLNNFRKKNKNEKVENTQFEEINTNISQNINIKNEIIKANEDNVIKEDFTEGLITTSRYNYRNNNNNNKLSLNGIDYIVLNNEELNKEFDVTDADKQIMSESKGKLVLSENEKDDKSNNMIRYKISTYKGQSGSPIFLRYKRISNSKKGEYVYQFLGLHSRRGPLKNFYESEKMSKLTENLLTNEIPGREYNNIVKNNIEDNFDDIKKKNNLNYNDNKKNYNEIIIFNGSCDYNCAVSILGSIIPKIISLVNKNLNEIKEMGNEISTNKVKSEFIYTKLLLNDEVKFCGLFKRYVPLSVLFSFASKIFNVPKEYILLEDIANPLGLSIQNFNYDQNKKLCEVMEDPDNSSSITFELMLNIKKYGEFIANNILQKYLENYDLEESQLKKDFKKHMKGLFHIIFREINKFENIPLTYGKLFKKIRKMILNKLGMTEQAKN